MAARTKSKPPAPGKRRRIAMLRPMTFHSDWALADGLCRYSLAWRDWQVSMYMLDPEYLRRHDFDVLIGEFGDPALYATYAPLGIPMIAALGRQPRQRMPFVELDHEEIGRMAAAHLLELGFRNFAFCFDSGDLTRHLKPRAPSTWTPERRLLEAFRAALGENAQSFAVCPPYDPLEDDWREPLVAWMRSLPMPVAMLCESDFVGRTFTDICRTEGIAVPGRVAVVGVNNDSHYCLSSQPRLTSVAVPWEKLGHELGTLLEEFFRTGKMPRRTVRIAPTGVVSRGSTSPVSSGEDPLVAEVIDVLRTRSHEHCNLKELLAGFPITRRQLERRFHAALGRTPLDELWRLRVEHAKELLTDSQLGFEDIAAACGFSGSKHLHRVFAALTQTTPREFRNRHAGGPRK